MAFLSFKKYPKICRREATFKLLIYTPNATRREGEKGPKPAVLAPLFKRKE